MKVKLLTFAVRHFDRMGDRAAMSDNWLNSFPFWAYADKLWSLREKEIAIGVSRTKAI